MVAQQQSAVLAIERARVLIPFATVSKFPNFLSPQCPSSLTGSNEYLAIDGGGNVSE